jgi:hypothetical protein
VSFSYALLIDNYLIVGILKAMEKFRLPNSFWLAQAAWSNAFLASINPGNYLTTFLFECPRRRG